MVSKARLDLPEPESPVTTMSLSRGNSSETFLRLCTRAPCTAIVVRAFFILTSDSCLLTSAFGLPLIRRVSTIKECQLIEVHIAPLRQPDRQRRVADESLVGAVFACHSA